MPSPDPNLPRRLRDNDAVRAGERHVMAATRKALRVLAAQVRAHLDRSGYSEFGLTEQWPEWQQAVDEHLVPAVRQVYERAFDEQVAEMTVTAATSMDAQHNAEEYLRRIRNRLTGVSQTTFWQVRRAIREGVEQREPLTEVANRVSLVLDKAEADNWSGRAMVIARTEVLSAFNMARLQAARKMAPALGLRIADARKEWLATHDTRTRHTHREVDGQQVTLNGRFTVGGHPGRCPGDPDLPPGEVISCRCTVLIRFPGDAGYRVPESLAAASGVVFDFNPDQKRGPDGRWIKFLTVASEIMAAVPDLDLNDDEKATLRNYQSSLYFEQMNRLLREGSLTDWDDPEEEIAGYVSGVEKLLGKADPLPDSIVTWRGTSGDWAKGLKVGDSFTDKGFVSVSADRDAAERFTGAGYKPPGAKATPPVGTLMRVRVSEGTKVLKESQGGISEYASEQAVTLSPGSHFTVADISEDGGRTVITVDLAAPSMTAASPPAPKSEKLPEAPRARRFLWLGSDVERGDLAAAGDVSADQSADYASNTPKEHTMTAPVVEDEAVSEQDSVSDLHDGVPIPWHGVLAPEGVMSGDRRKFAVDALRWRDLPLPLLYQDATAPGHDGAVRVANIRGINRVDGNMVAWGVFDSDLTSDEAVREIATQMLRGVSVDVDDATFEYETLDGQPVTFEGEQPDDEPVMVISDGRIAGATLCSIPAFQEAYVALGEPPSEWGFDEAVQQFAMPPRKGVNPFPPKDGKAPKSGPAAPPPPPKVKPNDPGPAPDGIVEGAYVQWDEGEGQVQKINGDSADVNVWVEGDGGDWAEDPGNVVTVPVAALKVWKVPGMADSGPDDGYTAEAEEFVEGHMPGKLKRYWVDGVGAAKIGWGSPGDFNRCRANLGKYVGPEMLSGLCANLHHAATGEWPGREHTADMPVTDGVSVTQPVEAALTASAALLSDFADPALPGPTALTVTDDGRIYGHLATWGTCHIGFQGQCITPPRSEMAYAYFMTGEAVTADGQRVPVGQITMDTGHARPNLGAAPAMAHYDDTGSVVADVAVGEDDHGIWVAGRLRDGVGADKRTAIAAAALSGDWRRVGSNLELVAALAVNVPGFPVPRVQSHLRAGRQTALVASGVVIAPEPALLPLDTRAIVKTAVREMRAMADRQARADRASRVIRKARLAAATRAITKGR